MDDAILVINAGSSSIKFSIFSYLNHKLQLLYKGKIEDLYQTPCITIQDANQREVLKKNINTSGHEAGLKIIFHWLQNLSNVLTLKAVGHRVVHGGTFFSQPTIVTDEVIKKLASLNPLAPLHQPHNLKAITTIQTLYPTLIQIVCFDTTFHKTQTKLAQLFAIPHEMSDQGIIRYGFHGISYEYIASVLHNYVDVQKNKRIIVAHLGNGASLCAMYDKKSVATSMGFSALDGLMMGTRCGRIDPGVLLYLIQEKKYSAKEVEHLLYNQSGLLGVSGMSNDVRELLASQDKHAILALDLFCYRAAIEVGSLFVALGGCDAFIFTGGIGENATEIRKKISDDLNCFGMKINEKLNQQHANLISEKNSSMLVGIIPSNEEYMIAAHVKNQLTV